MEYLKIDDLKFMANNVRNHPAHQLEALAESIRNFGFLNPILINQENEIIAGNGRAEAARLAGLEEIPAIRIESLTPEQERAYAIIENKITESGTWNYELLNTEIEAIGLDMSKYGFENFLQNKVDVEELPKEITIKEGGKELHLGTFEDEEFQYTCEACGFHFNA